MTLGSGASYAWCHYLDLMLIVVMLSVLMFIIVMLSIILLSADMLDVAILSGIMLNVAVHIHSQSMSDILTRVVITDDN
jgi:hypothetical protein